MNKELQDLHLKAMLWDLINERDATIEHDITITLTIYPPLKHWVNGDISAGQLSKISIQSNGEKNFSDAEFAAIEDARAVKSAFDKKYADLIALTADDIKRLKGGE